MNYADIQLTRSQQELIPKFQAFLDGPERIFLLTGMPGVGKTTMTKIMLAEHIRADRNSQSIYSINVAGICLAHRAKNVLGEHIPNVFTFAKAYGLKEHIDDETGKRTFVYDKYNDGIIIGQQNIPVFVHDEVSQYTDEMLRIVMERTPMFSKIIFIGDRAQLPPIDPENKMGRDADSPVFQMNIPESCKHELTDRVRQAKGNKILDLSDIIRQEIFGRQRLDLVLDAVRSPGMEDGLGYDFIKYGEFMDHIKDRDIMETLIIACRNDTVNKFNPSVRNYLMGYPDRMLVKGDIVTMTDNFYREDDLGQIKYSLQNSETFKLGDIYTQVTKFKAGKTYLIDTYVANIVGKQGQFIVPTESGEAVYQAALSEIADKCRARELRWHDHFWPLNDKFCKFTYGYATTAYKSQGSTYENVYIDINDIWLTRPLTPKRKLQTLYTGLTRARKGAWFLKN